MKIETESITFEGRQLQVTFAGDGDYYLTIENGDGSFGNIIVRNPYHTSEQNINVRKALLNLFDAIKKDKELDKNDLEQNSV